MRTDERNATVVSVVRPETQRGKHRFSPEKQTKQNIDDDEDNDDV